MTLDVGAVSFMLAGKPVPKARPRTYSDRTGRTRTITPRRTRDYEEQIGWAAKLAGVKLTDGPLEVRMRFVGSQADGDNLAKLVLDGLQGVAYHDDRQVLRHTVEVVRSDERPRTEVTIVPLGVS